jgi:two-component system, OmpR family, heavy metal sensor histidine kinase CusS
LLLAFGFSLPLVLFVAALGGWWVAGRALQPLHEFTEAAERIGAEHLNRRVEVPATDDEIRRMATVLNAMLGRLEKSFRQAQRFAADASHELRTPLTIMDGEVERLLREPALPAETERRLLSLQEEIARLQRITEQMLLLARFDAGGTGALHAPVDFSTAVRVACDDAELLATANGLTIQAEVAPNVTVRGNDGHLRQLLLNLLYAQFARGPRAARGGKLRTGHSGGGAAAIIRPIFPGRCGAHARGPRIGPESLPRDRARPRRHD